MLPHDGALLPAYNTFSIFSLSTGTGFHLLMLLLFRIASDSSILGPPFEYLVLLYYLDIVTFQGSSPTVLGVGGITGALTANAVGLLPQF